MGFVARKMASICWNIWNLSVIFQWVLSQENWLKYVETSEKLSIFVNGFCSQKNGQNLLKHLKNCQFFSIVFLAIKMVKICWNIWKLSFFNTFTGKLFSENHRFSLKIFKTLKRSHSVNFDRTRKLQTFLEPSDSVLSETIVFWHSISNRKMSRAANVRKVRKPL